MIGWSLLLAAASAEQHVLTVARACTQFTLTYGASTTISHRQISSRQGACDRARAAIAREVASRAADYRAHPIAVADRDSPAVLAELESVRTLTSDGHN